MDTVHRDGTIWNLSMMVILLLFPVTIGILFNATPDWQGVGLGLLATAPMYWVLVLLRLSPLSLCLVQADPTSPSLPVTFLT